MDWALQIGNLSIGILDMVIIGIILISAIGCTVAGFSRSAAKSIGWVLCYPVALYLTSFVARFFNENSNIGLFFSTMLAFAVMSVAVFAIFNLLGAFLGSILSGVGLGAIDSILGFVWGTVVAFIISGILIYIISAQAIVDVTPLIDKSFMYGFISPLLPSTKDMILEAWNAVL